MDESGPSAEYVVLYAQGASLSAAHAAVAAARGTVVKENIAVGVATVRSSNPTFLRDVVRQPAVAGVARNMPIGKQAPVTRPNRDAIERADQNERAAAMAAAKKPDRTRCRTRSRWPTGSGTWR